MQQIRRELRRARRKVKALGGAMQYKLQRQSEGHYRIEAEINLPGQSESPVSVVSTESMGSKRERIIRLLEENFRDSSRKVTVTFD